jgi:putative DNA primase/helicase
LYGKLANIYADLPAIALKETGIFKMLTGGDTISGEHKFKPRFYFKNYAKLIFSCNQIPQTPDDSDAFYRRWIIVNFPHQFLDADQNTDKNLVADKNLLAKLTTTSELRHIQLDAGRTETPSNKKTIHRGQDHRADKATVHPVSRSNPSI